MLEPALFPAQIIISPFNACRTSGAGTSSKPASNIHSFRDAIDHWVDNVATGVEHPSETQAMYLILDQLFEVAKERIRERMVELAEMAVKLRDRAEVRLGPGLGIQLGGLARKY